MCGIGGILGGDLRADERETLALRLRAGLTHRGPDGAGLFSSGTSVLVHTRLAILDPFGTAGQPMCRGPLALTFNGEIYDFCERRKELERQGIRFYTETDTEVLLALYAFHGEACLPLLRGMFAFAIRDQRDESCLLARDPFGIKPLYFAAFSGGGLAFASEVRAILATGLVPRRIDPAGLDGFLATGSVPEPHTMVAGIQCLPAGQTLRWNPERQTVRSYFEINFDPAHEADRSESLRPALVDSVQRHLVRDVPVGLLLSGGLDSSVLLALAQRRGHDQLTTFSLGMEDTSLDEAAPARALARHFGARHHELLLTHELARHWIEDFLDAIDQPTVDGFNMYCACKLAHDHGFKVVLSGLGADELFGGYPSFRRIPRLQVLGRVLPRAPLAIAGRALARMSPDARVARASDYLRGRATLTGAYRTFRGVFADSETVRLRQAFLNDSPPMADEYDHDDDASASNAISRLELTRYLRNQLLRDADVMSMAHGVELRVPMLDVPLFQVLRGISATRRLQPDKALLREAVPELPAGLLAPRKRAFGLPFAAWLAEWGDLATDLPALPRIALSPWYRRWSLIVLTRWLARHGLTSA